MRKNSLEPIMTAFRGGASDLGSRTQATVTQIASSVGRILDEAGTEGVKIRQTLARNWTSLVRPRRNRSAPLLFGALGVGIAAAYLLRRVAVSSQTSRG